MNIVLTRVASSSLFFWDSSSVMMLSSQPVSSLASRTFWPVRPIAWARFSSSTTISMLCASSSTLILLTSAGASALITNCAGSVGPQDDVDALAGELGGHGLHARAAHADAGADRVDAPVLGMHRDLRARARDRAPPP